MKISKTVMAGWACIAAATWGIAAVGADEQKRTTEPVYRVGHNPGAATSPTVPASATAVPAIAASNAVAAEMHPLDRALLVAHEGLAHIQNNIADYTAIMVKRERINGNLLEPEYMSIKVRNRRQGPQGDVPLSIYMRFLRPKAVCGREVIWVEGRNNNRIVAHDAGIRGIVRVNLDPNGFMAMQNNRYPIYEAGIENLVLKLIERAESEKERGTCIVEFVENVRVNDRVCTMIQVTHPQQKPEYEFHIARVFIDNELNIPIRYAAYSWPTTPGGQPELEEEYTYLRVEINVGLTDRDFDPNNPEYEYP